MLNPIPHCRATRLAESALLWHLVVSSAACGERSQVNAGTGESSSTSSSTSSVAQTSDAETTSSSSTFATEESSDSSTGSPVPLRWTSVAVGEDHGCAVDETQQLYCWGSNVDGQLGIGGEGPRGPTLVPLPEASLRSVAAGSAHTCAVSEFRDLYCFGRGDTGALGTGVLEPVQAPTIVGQPGSWTGVAGFSRHSCGAGLDGALMCWGSNDHGQSASSKSAVLASPSFVGAETSWGTVVAGGDAHTCALDESGFVWCWGWNSDFRLGTSGDGSDIAAPLMVAGLQGIALGSTVSGTLAITPEGELHRWGGFFDGLGVALVGPQRVGERSDWVAVSFGMGRSHACVLDSAGEISCIGDDADGQIGDGEEPAGASELTAIAKTGPWLAVATGGDQSCAITFNEQALYCWGAFTTSTDADVCPLAPTGIDTTRPVAMCDSP